MARGDTGNAGRITVPAILFCYSGTNNASNRRKYGNSQFDPRRISSPSSDRICGRSRKNDTYDVAVGVEYSGKVTDAMDWIEKNVTGELQIYRVKDNKLVASYSFFNKKDNQPKAGAGGLYLNKKIHGETYSVSLDRGNYIILLRAFLKNDVLDSDIEPAVFISFNRFRNPWW